MSLHSAQSPKSREGSPKRASDTDMTPVELKQLIDEGVSVVILDIREPQELEICRLPNTLHIPMSSLAERVGELESYKESEIVVYCRSGGRSANCCAFMREKGYRAINLTGGILAWSDQVDPTVAKY